ncbi:STY0301 family protein [Roseomonas sp. CAU 1739]|uniref:STY0301 family protein n=1 Tax=Roseomonas sp. CAU 1739 TaxID=3140364 RepID=UPI00325BF9F3
MTLRLVVIGIALVLAMPALAQELPTCPEHVTVTDGLDGAVPQGWQHLRRESRHHLVDIRFYAEAPPGGTVIEAVGASSRGTVVSLRYSLPSVESEVWMSCVYADTAHTLIRGLAGPFPPHVRVNHDRQDGRTFITYN